MSGLDYDRFIREVVIMAAWFAFCILVLPWLLFACSIALGGG